LPSANFTSAKKYNAEIMRITRESLNHGNPFATADPGLYSTLQLSQKISTAMSASYLITELM